MPRLGGGRVLPYQRNTNGDAPDIEHHFESKRIRATADKTIKTTFFASLIGCTQITINATKISKQQSTGTVVATARSTRGIEQ